VGTGTLGTDGTGTPGSGAEGRGTDGSGTEGNGTPGPPGRAGSFPTPRLPAMVSRLVSRVAQRFVKSPLMVFWALFGNG
jgi:hypothetical protein